MNSNVKNEILSLCVLHGSKLHEAAEALQLLRRAVQAMDAGQPLRDVLSSEDPVAQLLASELTENILFQPLHDAERQLRAAQESLRHFVRLFNGCCGIAKHRGGLHE